MTDAGERPGAASLASVAGLGFAAQVFQVLVLREVLGQVEGSEAVVGISLGAWLLGGAAGALAGRRAEKRLLDPGRALAAAAPAAALLATGALLAVRFARGLLPLAPGEPPGIAAGFGIAAVGSLVPALGYGFAFPLAARLAGGAGAWTAEAAGALAGGALFTFALAGAFPPLGIAGLLLALAGAAALPRAPLLGLLPLIAGLAASGAGTVLERASREAAYGAWLPGHRLLATGQSRRGSLDVLGLREQASLYRQGRLDFTSPDPEGAARKAHLALTLCPSPDRVLLAGGGPGVVKEALRHPVRAMDCAEVDPEALAFMDRFLAPADLRGREGAEVRVLGVDPRGALRLPFPAIEGPPYALVAILGTDPSTVAGNRFYTEEFFREASRRTGMLVLSLPGRGEYWPEDLLRRNALVVAAARESFPSVGTIPGVEGFLVASRESFSLDPALLESRFRERRISSPGFRPEEFHLLLPPGEVEALGARMDAAVAALGGERNRDSRPAACFRTLLHRAREEGLPLDALASPWCAALAGVLLLGLLLLAARKGGPGAASVGSTGFAAMALETMALLGYQSAQGDLHVEVGLLAALFMAGLAIGARVRVPLRAADLALAALCAAAPLMYHWTILFFAVSLAAGLVAGATFPAALAEGGEPARLYAIDLAGAAPGAALVGSLLLPAAGAGTVAVLLVAMKSVSAALGDRRGSPGRPPAPASPG